MINTLCYFMSQCCQHVSAHTEPPSWRRKQGNASCVLVFAVILQSTKCAFVFIHDVTASDIICIYNVLFIHY